MPTAARLAPVDPHASHHASHEDSSRLSPLAHQSHPAHQSQEGAHASREVENSHHRVAMESLLVWVPTCLCGCGDSRALIGGGAARLGPVVPPALVVDWPASPIRLAAETVPRPIQAPDFLIDPIPI